MSEHPTPAELAAFLEENLSPERFREVVQHLVQGCHACSQFLFPLYDDVEIIPGDAPVTSEDEYDEAITRAFEAVRAHARHLRMETEMARKIIPLLEAEGGQEGLTASQEIPFRGLGALQALLERSWAVRHESPREMVALARRAVDVAQHLDPKRYTPELLAEYESRAWGELGNALRVSDDLDEAERAFGIAFDLYLLGTGNPFFKAHLYDLHASYLGTRRRFDLAFAALDIVHETYLEVGERHLAGRALLIKAIYTHYSGRPEEAIRINREGLELIDKGRDPNLAFFADHNNLLFLIACGLFPDANKALFLLRPNLQNITGRVNALKIRWLEGQIAAGLKQWESAERALLEVRAGFEAAGMGFHAALSSLELALAWMRQDQYREAEELVLDTVEVFIALRIKREALGAMMVLRDAFEKESATVGLLEGTVDYLRRLEIDPEARFDPVW